MVLGNARIFFITKKGMANTPTVPMKTPTGDVRVSTPEATALDLVRYPQHAGSLSNVATVLADLAEKMKSEDLVRAAELEGELAGAQRVSYLLERIGQRPIAEPLAAWIDRTKPRLVPLRPGWRTSGRRRDPRWHLAVNEKIEMDGPHA